MSRLSISDYVSYFESKISTIINSLQQQNLLKPNIENSDGTITSPYNLVFFTDSGQYHKRIKEPNLAKDKTYPEILVLIKDGGGGQDVTSSLDVFLQVLSFEIYAWDDKTDEYKNQRADIQLIFGTFVQSYKLVTDTYKNNSLKIEADTYPTYGAQLENKHFITQFNIDVTSLFYAQLSNNDQIQINGVIVPYVNFTTARQTSTTTTLEKMTETKYLINKSNYKLDATLLYVTNNTMIQSLVNQCDTNEAFEQIYTVSIIRNGVTVNNYNMVLANISLARSYGSVIAISVSFIPAYIME